MSNIMKAGVHDIYIEKGTTFELIIEARLGDDEAVIDLSEYDYKAQIKNSANDAVALIDFTCELFEGTSLKISLTPAQTASLTSSGDYYKEKETAYYDVKITHKTEGTVLRLLNGVVEISPQVSI